MNKYLDTHIHLDLFDDIDETINLIKKHKIYVLSMTNHPKVYEVMKAKVDSPYVRIALGMHPQLIDKVNLALFKENTVSTKYIGEVGLDFSDKYMTIKTKNAQIDAFNYILNLSNKKVISIHSRKAEQQIIYCIKENFNNKSFKRKIGGH